MARKTQDKATSSKQGSGHDTEPKSLQHVGILGGGAWGTALAQTMRRAGRDATLWAYEPETVLEITNHHTNRIYLPGVNLDQRIHATAKVSDLASCDVILIVVPSQFVRPVAEELAPHVADGTPVVICTKGLEAASGKVMTEVVAECLPKARLAVLSGPSFAGEVARNLPAALTLACEGETLGQALAEALGHRTFRLYWTDDILGAQIGGTVKNVLAIATGIVDGRQLGASAHAAVTTRGFAELARFGMKLGARYETMTGLSGLGDLILTCSSEQSRNMSLGQALGRGKTLSDVLGARKSVAEGYHSAAAVVEMARGYDVDMPICEAVANVVAGRVNVEQAIDALLSRPLRAEADALSGAMMRATV
jgi:glycerol-3-phosphate dehydrogenase (NAD(P)+)